MQGEGVPNVNTVWHRRIVEIISTCKGLVKRALSLHLLVIIGSLCNADQKSKYSAQAKVQSYGLKGRNAEDIDEVLYSQHPTSSLGKLFHVLNHF